MHGRAANAQRRTVGTALRAVRPMNNLTNDSREIKVRGQHGVPSLPCFSQVRCCSSSQVSVASGQGITIGPRRRFSAEEKVKQGADPELPLLDQFREEHLSISVSPNEIAETSSRGKPKENGVKESQNLESANKGRLAHPSSGLGPDDAC